MEASQPVPPHNSPALFGVLVLPYGFTGSVTTLLMPYLLRKDGMPVDQIANLVAVAMLPSIWAFLWSPLADAGYRRRTWVLLSSLGAGLAAATAILGIHGSHVVLSALLFLMNAFAGLLSSACGALLTAMPESLRGRSAGWYQGGNTGGAAMGGGLVIWLADHASLPVVATVIVAAMVLPALTAFLIEEPAPVRRAIGSQIVSLAHDLGEVFRARRTWLGLVFFLSPVGSAAIGNLISGLGPDYRASGNEVLWVTGIGGGLLSALGCYIGGVIADRMNRMAAYALAGGLAAVFGVYLGLAHATPFTYGAGYSGYALSSGFAYAVFTALLLDVVGRRRHAAASAYATLNAAGNIPITYMTWLDGVGYKRRGVPGLMLTDAAANAVFGIVLLLLAMFAGHHWHHRATDADLPSEA
jgi:MFS transporter, PAT family, beta-lactamase induction signal transducer AmpG